MSKNILMSEELEQEKNLCPTCGHLFSDAYCAHCGEKRIDPQDFSLKRNSRLLLATFTDLDFKFFRSIWFLLVKPGFLTLEYLRGRRKPFVNPIKLFFIVNAIYFFVQPYTGVRGFNTNLYSHMNRQIYSPLAQQIIHAKFRGKDKIPKEYRNKFDVRSKTFAKTLIFIMIPILALILALLQINSGRFFVEHLIFSIHFYTFLIFYFYCILLLLLNFTLFLHPLKFIMEHFEFIFFTFNMVIVSIYFYLGFNRLYPRKWWGQIPRALVLSLSIYLVTIIYRFLLFFITYLTT